MFKYLKLFLIASAIVTIAANSIPNPSAPLSQELQPGETGEKFENLKVLPKDITEEQLDSVMDNFRASLGVKCSFCHAASKDTSVEKHLDFASDEKNHKLIAREMMQMTNYLNETFFNPDHSSRPDTIHEVICYTCHRGTKEPEAGPLFLEVDSIMKLQHQRK